jgi:hypothetical protein
MLFGATASRAGGDTYLYVPRSGPFAPTLYSDGVALSCSWMDVFGINARGTRHGQVREGLIGCRSWKPTKPVTKKSTAICENLAGPCCVSGSTASGTISISACIASVADSDGMADGSVDMRHGNRNIRKTYYEAGIGLLPGTARQEVIASIHHITGGVVAICCMTDTIVLG